MNTPARIFKSLFRPYLLATLFSIIFVPSLETKNIVFDMGGVLVETSNLYSFTEIGLAPFAKHILYNPMQIFKIRKKLRSELYRLLEAVQPLREKIIVPPCRDEYGIIYPPIIHSWLRGDQNNQEILEEVACFLAEQPDFFDCTTIKTIVYNTICMIFTPKRFVRTQRLSKAMHQLVIRYKKQGHQLYILSNWDKSSWPLIYEKYKDFFDLFNGIVISGNIGSVKPLHYPYRYLLDHYNLDPADCIFIDNQEENIKAAQEMGMTGILYTPIKTMSSWFCNQKSMKQLQTTINTFC